jgi:biopolymer transport protein ExbB
VPETSAFGLSHFWAQGDIITHSLTLILVVMSVACWSVIFGRLWQAARAGQSLRAVERFWLASSLKTGVGELEQNDRLGLFAPLAKTASEVAEHLKNPEDSAHALRNSLDGGELLTRALRRSLGEAQGRLESGLTLLASVGSTAPFVGLFGTVWGIYHALLAIASSGKAGLEAVAGPVGEALIMTALGLAVAIPAVLAYNAFTRRNRIWFGQMDGFAHDLYVLLVAGAPARQSGVAGVAPHLTARAA